jgi:hypothetical protein
MSRDPFQAEIDALPCAPFDPYASGPAVIAMYRCAGDALAASRFIHQIDRVRTMQDVHDIRRSFPLDSAPDNVRTFVNGLLLLAERVVLDSVMDKQQKDGHIRQLSAAAFRMGVPMGPASRADLFLSMVAMSLVYLVCVFSLPSAVQFVCWLFQLIHLFVWTGPKLRYFAVGRESSGVCALSLVTSFLFSVYYGIVFVSIAICYLATGQALSPHQFLVGANRCAV